MSARDSVYAVPEHRYVPEDPRPLHLIKAHRFRADLCERADRILMTRRDLRDIAASAVRVGLVEGEFGVVGVASQVVADHRAWRPHCAVELAYEEVVADKLAATARVVDALFEDDPAQSEGGRPIDCAALNQAVEALSPPSRARAEAEAEPGHAPYDPVTLMVPRHVTDGRAGGYAQTLPHQWIKVIEDMHGDWLEANGYARRSQ